MTDRIRVVTSTVAGTIWGTAMVAGAVLVVALVMTALTTPVLLTVAAAAVIGVLSAVVVFPARVNVSVDERGVRYGRTADRTRWIPREQIAAIESVRVGSGAIIGGGVRLSAATQRRIVRAGWALHLSLTNGEEIWLSMRTALDAREVLPGLEFPAVTGSKHNRPVQASARNEKVRVMGDRKPWFGSKRVGIGLRPQTWQGWLITAIGVAIIVVVVTLLTR